MDMTQVAANAGGIFSSFFLIATYTMTTMIPLRIFGIITNLLLIVFSFVTGHYPTMALHMVLLPLNAYRLHQMLQLVRDVKKSVHSDLSMAWLKPFMTERPCATGEVVFYKDEKAEEMFYIVSGRFRLVEMGIELPHGTLVGEFGMLSPSNKRTGTLECIEGGLILAVSYRQVEELYVQNPAFGFYFLRLVSARLFENLGRMEARIGELTAAQAQGQMPAQAKTQTQGEAG
ncbi:MAG: cyclic nucleotide-binding domain-containing protein [Xanthobacteraceae bacterium]